MIDNYPPGVSGMEPAIIGRDEPDDSVTRICRGEIGTEVVPVHGVGVWIQELKDAVETDLARDDAEVMVSGSETAKKL